MGDISWRKKERASPASGYAWSRRKISIAADQVATRTGLCLHNNKKNHLKTVLMSCFSALTTFFLHQTVLAQAT